VVYCAQKEGAIVETHFTGGGSDLVGLLDHEFNPRIASWQINNETSIPFPDYQHERGRYDAKYNTYADPQSTLIKLEMIITEVHFLLPILIASKGDSK
jgi:hypothetical protein